MAVDRPLVLTALVALGAALVVFPFLPGAWPSPLPEGEAVAAPTLLRLREAAQRVDDACARGDVAAFTAAVTPAHRRRLERELRAVDRALDADTVQRLASDRPLGFAALLDRPLLATAVRDGRAALVVARPDGGAQLVQFAWDGRALRLAGCREAVEAVTRARAQALATDAVAE